MTDDRTDGGDHGRAGGGTGLPEGMELVAVADAFPLFRRLSVRSRCRS